MPSEIKHVRASDVFVNNGVLNLRTGAQSNSTQVAVAEWTLTAVSPREAHRLMLAHGISIVAARFPACVLWLMTCERFGRPDSRNSRYRDAHISNRLRRLPKSFGRVIGERLVEKPDEYRFFRLQQFDSGAQQAAVTVVAGSWASYIVAVDVREERKLMSVLESGWERPDFGPSREVLDAVCRADGFLFWPTGEFDDREAGCAVFSKPELIELLPR